MSNYTIYIYVGKEYNECKKVRKIAYMGNEIKSFLGGLDFLNVQMLLLQFLQLFSAGKENKLSYVLLNILPLPDVNLFYVLKRDHYLLLLYPSRTIYISVEVSLESFKPDLLAWKWAINLINSYWI